MYSRCCLSMVWVKYIFSVFEAYFFPFHLLNIQRMAKAMGEKKERNKQKQEWKKKIVYRALRTRLEAIFQQFVGICCMPRNVVIAMIKLPKNAKAWFVLHTPHRNREKLWTFQSHLSDQIHEYIYIFCRVSMQIQNSTNILVNYTMHTHTSLHFHIINMLYVTLDNHEKIIKDTKINITIYAFVKKRTCTHTHTLQGWRERTRTTKRRANEKKNENEHSDELT